MYRDPLRRPGIQRRHVLLIEDNEDGRESLRMLLSVMGHQVETAADGVEGVEKALADPPDVAIIDIGLPRMSGYEVARRLRAVLGRRVVLVACTAYDSPEARRRVIQSGFDVHIVKPMEINELLPWLERKSQTESPSSYSPLRN